MVLNCSLGCPSISHVPNCQQGKETLAQPITIYISRASKEAIQAIEGNGGKVTTVYYNKLGIKYLLKPEQFGTTKRIPRPALPVRRYLIGMSIPLLVSHHKIIIQIHLNEDICRLRLSIFPVWALHLPS